MSLPESHINRIDLGIDWSKCTRKEIEFLELAVDMADFQLNALCNNRLAYIAELEEKLSATDDPIQCTEIKDEIRQTLQEIESSKRQGVFQDYGYLKRRIAEGESADAVYPMMPHFYAMAYDHVRRINARPAKHKKSFFALIGGMTLIGVLANLITIRDSGLANRLKELLQEILRM